jgi:hypothetical protein
MCILEIAVRLLTRRLTNVPPRLDGGAVIHPVGRQ